MFPLPFNGFSNIMFDIVPVFITLIFIFVFGTIIVRGVQAVKQWKT